MKMVGSKILFCGIALSLYSCGQAFDDIPVAGRASSSVPFEQSSDQVKTQAPSDDVTADEEPPMPFAIVSDFDDTLKQTNTQSAIGNIYNGLFTNDPFLGMNQLFDLMSIDAETTGMFIVSGAPEQLQGQVENFFAVNEFVAPDQVYLRDLIENFSTFDHKIAALELINTTVAEKLVLVGDDTEEDPEIYLQFATSNPEKISAIYIHKVQGLTLDPAVFKTYLTAFDLAYWEMKNKHLTVDSVRLIGEGLLASDIRTMIPEFAVCPTPEDKLPIPADHELYELYESLWAKLNNEC